MSASGFVTAGGMSSRMGTDKAWLKLGGRPMIEHVIDALLPVTNQVAIIANGHEYQRLGLQVFADRQIGVGPLEAIRTALSNSSTPQVILVGCDLPFVTADLFRLLLRVAGTNQATIPIGADEKLEPLCAVYHREALAAVDDLIATGQRKTSLLFDRVPTRLVAFRELSHLPGSDRFFENINTPEDYQRITKALEPSPG